jgi:hypothetical protein
MKAIVGLFEGQEEADRAIRELEAAGFAHNQFSLVARDNIVQVVNRQEDREQGTVQAEEKLGPTGGAVIGGLTGLLIGVAALAIPGIGPVIAAGTVAATLGAAAGMGAVTGGLLGALTSLGISEEEAGLYAEGVKRGGVLVVVETELDRAGAATQALRQAGAMEVSVRRERWREQGWAGFDENALPGENYPNL